GGWRRTPGGAARSRAGRRTALRGGGWGGGGGGGVVRRAGGGCRGRHDDDQVALGRGTNQPFRHAHGFLFVGTERLTVQELAQGRLDKRLVPVRHQGKGLLHPLCI